MATKRRPGVPNAPPYPEPSPGDLVDICGLVISTGDDAIFAGPAWTYGMYQHGARLRIGRVVEVDQPAGLLTIRYKRVHRGQVVVSTVKLPANQVLRAVNTIDADGTSGMRVEVHHL